MQVHNQNDEKIVVWGQNGINSEISIIDIDYKKIGSEFDKLIIQGTVKLLHPEDLNFSDKPKTISIKCFNLIFENNAELVSPSNLEIQVDNIVQGNANISSVRGIPGINGSLPPPQLPKLADSPSGGNGPPGKDAIEDGFLKPGRGASSGDNGGNGGRGVDGQHGQHGQNGGNGGDASSITFRVRKGFFSGNDSLAIKTNGGVGANGGDGQRGQDGSNGGNGGNGGSGGKGDGTRGAADGGHGGNGGDGGNGGNGGDGGNGGNGGDGGQIFVDIRGKIIPFSTKFECLGGNGGRGGLGGIPGLGGTGGGRGEGGKGGTAHGVFDGDDKNSGNDGHPGIKGNDGHKGKDGRWGNDGIRGIASQPNINLTTSGED
jgi:hypothetical protein